MKHYKLWRGVILGALMLGGVFGMAAAQGDVLPIELGQEVTGTLTRETPVVTYELVADAGTSVTIFFGSNDFDNFLVLEDSAGNTLATDDDSGGSLDSRIGPLSLPPGGPYRIIGQSLSSYRGSTPEVGSYTLRVETFEAERIEYTQVINGELTASNLTRYYLFTGSAGDNVVIAMNSSDFDSFLRLNDPAGVELTSNDDGGGNLNSLIGPFELPSTGEYQIAASSLNGSSTGSFSLELRRAEVTNIAYGETVQSELTRTTARQFFALNAEAGDVVNITVAASGSADLNLVVTDPYNYQVMSDEDSGAGVNPEIFGLSISQTGRYMIGVGSLFGDVGGFSITVTRAQVPSLDEGAQVLTFGGGRTQNRVKFTGVAGETVRLNIEISGGAVSPSIEVLQGGTSITYASFTSITSTSFSFITPNNGDVSIGVTEYSGNTTRMTITLERGS